MKTKASISAKRSSVAVNDLAARKNPKGGGGVPIRNSDPTKPVVVATTQEAFRAGGGTGGTGGCISDQAAAGNLISFRR